MRGPLLSKMKGVAAVAAERVLWGSMRGPLLSVVKGVAAVKGLRAGTGVAEPRHVGQEATTAFQQRRQRARDSETAGRAAGGASARNRLSWALCRLGRFRNPSGKLKWQRIRSG